MHKSCSYCYFKDQCGQDEVCEDYYPVDSVSAEYEVRKYIEQNRRDFHTEWFRYIDEGED